MQHAPNLPILTCCLWHCVRLYFQMPLNVAMCAISYFTFFQTVFQLSIVFCFPSIRTYIYICMDFVLKVGSPSSSTRRFRGLGFIPAFVCFQGYLSTKCVCVWTSAEFCTCAWTGGMWQNWDVLILFAYFLLLLCDLLADLTIFLVSKLCVSSFEPRARHVNIVFEDRFRLKNNGFEKCL